MNRKENEAFPYIENPEEIIGFEEIPVPEDLDQKIQAGILEGKRRQKRIRFEKAVKAGIGIAAALVLTCGICVSNPTLAAKLPIFGHIFEQMEDKTSVKGDFSKVAQILETETVRHSNIQQEEMKADTAYSKTSGDVTVTLSEVYYNKNAMYLAMTLESEEGFPENIMLKKNKEEYALDYDTAGISGVMDLSFMNDEKFVFDYLEGEFTDNHTFAGVFRIDLSMLQEVPDMFTCKLQLKQIRFSTMSRDEEDDLIYEGNWKFDLDVKLDTEETQTVEIDEVNENGVGLEKVVKTRYELCIYTIDPEMKYFAEIFDANGEKMDYAGSYANSRQTYGYDTSKIRVYFCDEEEYMNELKGYYYSEAYEEQRKIKSYEEYIEEHAVYKKEIVFDK